MSTNIGVCMRNWKVYLEVATGTKQFKQPLCLLHVWYPFPLLISTVLDAWDEG